MALAEEEEEYERTILILSSSLVQVSLMIPFHSSMQPTTLYEWFPYPNPIPFLSILFF